MKSRLLMMFIVALALAAGALNFQTLPSAAAPELWTPYWTHDTVGSTSGDVGFRSSIAFNPVTHQPYVAYYDSQNGNLNLGYYVGGSGGNCAMWQCMHLDGNSQSQTGAENAIAFDSGGNAWVAYTDPFLAKFSLLKLKPDFTKVISPVIDGAGPGDNQSGTENVRFPSLVMWNDMPRAGIWYSHAKGNEATYFNPTAPNAFKFDQIVGTTSQSSSLSQFGSLDIQWASPYHSMLAYRGQGNDDVTIPNTLNYADDIGVGNNLCPLYPGQIFGLWACHLIDPSPNTGNFISFHAKRSASDPAQIAYYDATNHFLKYAKYVGGSGTCGDHGDPGWECIAIETVGDMSAVGGISMVVDANGVPTIAYTDRNDYANSILKVARYVGAGGNCGIGSGQNLWRCVVVDRGLTGGPVDTVGANPALALSPDGRVYISYYNSTQHTLRVAYEQGQAPTFSKTYTPNDVPVNSVVQAKYTIKNNMNITLDGLHFTDTISPTLYAYQVVQANPCNSTVTIAPDNGSLSLFSGQLAAGASCSFTVNMLAKKPGTWLDNTGLLFSDQAHYADGAPSFLIIDAPATTYKLYLPVIQR